MKDARILKGFLVFVFCLMVIAAGLIFLDHKASATDAVVDLSNPAAYWTSWNPVLSRGVRGTESDTGLYKFGDGSTQWASLPYANLANFYTAPTVSTTFTSGDCGKLIGVSTDALVHTLPTTSAGCGMTFKNVGAAGNNIISIKAPAGFAFYGTCFGGGTAGIANVITSATGSTLTNTKATAKTGDTVTILYTGGTGTTLLVSGCTGTWTAL